MRTWDYQILAVVIAFAMGVAPGTVAQNRLPGGNAGAGRALALQACTGCHVVVPDQPFKPVYVGSPRPPDFKNIANKSNVTTASLEHFLGSLPTIPQDSKMANPDLTSQEIKDVAAFIVTLRDKSRK